MNSILDCRLLLLFSLALAGCNTNVTPPPIVIGHVSDKTRLDKAGDQAELGIRLALHDVSKDGALDATFGGRKIQVRHTDAHGEIAAFESEAVRLDAINRSLALLGGLSAKEVTALDHVKQPVLTFHGQPVSGASSQIIYLGMSATRQAEALAKSVGKGNVVIVLDERRPDREAFAEAFESYLVAERKKEDAPVSVSILRFRKDVKWTDLGERVRWSEFTERLHSKAPAIVVFAGDVQDFNAFHTPFRDKNAQGVELVYAGNDGDQRVFDLVGNESPILLATAFYADPKSEKIRDFLKAFRDMPRSTEADVHAVLAYDGFRLLVEAMKQTSTQLTSEKVREKLLEIKDFEGLTGPLTISADRQVQRPIFAMNWQNGTLKLVKSFP